MSLRQIHFTQGHNDATHYVSHIIIILRWIDIQSKQTVNWTLRLQEKLNFWSVEI